MKTTKRRRTTTTATAVTKSPPDVASAEGRKDRKVDDDDDVKMSPNEARNEESDVPLTSHDDSNDKDKDDGKKRKSTHRTATQSVPPPRAQSSSSSSSSSSSMMTFENFCTPRRFSEGVLEYTRQQNFQYMTPVQIATIPQFLNHKDVAVQSVTGSGKTLAFVIPIVELLLRLSQEKKAPLKSQQIGALILSPTRELAQQTYRVAKDLCRCCQQPEPLLLVGGGSSGSSGSSSNSAGHSGSNNTTSSSSSSNARPVTMDIQTFQKLGSNIVIGTPGRVNDILSRYAVIDCNELICLVLDEADVLLNMGFTMTLQSIMSYLPKMRRTALFSATQSSSTSTSLSEWMQRVGMRNPIWIDVTIVAPNTVTRNDTTATTASIMALSSPSSQSASNAGSRTDGTTTSHDDNNNNNNNNNDNNKSSNTTTTKKYQATPLSLQNYYIVSKMDEKISRLATFLYDHATLKNEKIIVFFLTCACVDFYGTVFQHLFQPPSSSKHLNNNKNNSKQTQASIESKEKHIIVEMLHGKMVQKRREKTMERFRMSRIGDADKGDNNDGPDHRPTNGIALFCTDVAARGLDVSDIQWVVQMDAPQDPSFFIHRVGRCARANKIGQSLLFVSPKEESYIDFLRMRNIPIEPLPHTEDCCPPSPLSLSDAVTINNCAVNNDDSETNNLRRLIYGPRRDESTNNMGMIDDVLPKIYNLVTTDRDILEKGTKAFTSYIRAYKEHHCAFIFRYVLNAVVADIVLEFSVPARFFYFTFI